MSNSLLEETALGADALGRGRVALARRGRLTDSQQELLQARTDRLLDALARFFEEQKARREGEKAA